jgi:hypothetical protein
VPEGQLKGDAAGLDRLGGITSKVARYKGLSFPHTPSDLHLPTGTVLSVVGSSITAVGTPV